METKTMEEMNQASTTEVKPEGVTSGAAVSPGAAVFPFTATDAGSGGILHTVDSFASHNLGSVNPPDDSIQLAVWRMSECIRVIPQEQLDEVLFRAPRRTLPRALRRIQRRIRRPGRTAPEPVRRKPGQRKLPMRPF